MSTSIAYKHYLRVLSRWPADTLRPELQLRDALRRRVDRTFLPRPAPTSPSTSASTAPISPSTSASTAPTPPINETAELEQVNALYSLLVNRYSKKYPIRGSLMTPASKPTYFEDLLKELEEAPKRSWLQATLNRWKGFVRFK